MKAEEMLQDCPTLLIALFLLIGMLIANEFGFRLGIRERDRENDLSRSVSNALKGSIFGLVALLLGFSFSATTSRHDLRQRLVLDQANAVGTCYLRAGLLDLEIRKRIQSILRRYVDLRIELFDLGRDKSELKKIEREIDACLTDLWVEVERSNDQNPEAVRTSLIVPAANLVIDLSSTRAWATRNHLPVPVLILLLLCVLVSCLLLGHSSGQSNRRHIGLWIASNVVLALVLYVVLDFDRPRRGLIQVDHTPLLELRDSIADPGAGK